MLHISKSARYLTIVEHMRANYWLVPTLMCIASFALALTSLYFNRRYMDELAEIEWFYSGGTTGARGLLSTIAGSAITVAGIVFSMNIVALTMASQQFGPRLLNNFVRDIGNQITLGVFTATYIFCLLILREIKGEDDYGPAFVPQLSVTIAVVFAGAGIAVLIYFVHHVAMSIQAPKVAAKIGLELENAIKNEFPERLEKHAKRRSQEEQLLEFQMPDFELDGCPVVSDRSGYLQAVDFLELMHLARRFDMVIQLAQRPGQFVIEGTPILSAVPCDHVTIPIYNKLMECFTIGRTRNASQDIEFIVNQLTELAIRALSSSINDPFTAINCIDWLGASLEELMGRDYPRGFLTDKNERLRVLWKPSTQRGVINAAFHLIRQNSEGNVAVTIRLLEVLARIARAARDDEDRETIQKHVDMIFRGAQASITEPNDLADAARRYQEANTALASAGVL